MNTSSTERLLKFLDEVFVQLMLNQFPEGLDQGLIEDLLELEKLTNNTIS